MPALPRTTATTEEIRFAIQAWKEGDRSAAQAEQAVAEASFLYDQRRGPPVADDLIGDARLLRSLANDRLARALRMMRS